MRGVHAWGQVASYSGPVVPLAGLNALLPEDVSVLACSEASGRIRCATRRDVARVLLPDLAAPGAQRPAPRTRVALAATSGSLGFGGLRGCPRGNPRLHRVHPHRDRARALFARRVRGVLGFARRGARVLDRGRRVHAPHEPGARRDDARGLVGAAARVRFRRATRRAPAVEAGPTAPLAGSTSRAWDMGASGC